MSKQEFRTKSLDELTDKYIGEQGSENRERFEFELQMELLGDMIRRSRKEMNLTQEEMGKIVGVQKAQISKIENNTKDVRFSTVVRVFKALKAKVKLVVELDKDAEFDLA
ncbi:MAG: helix-turn-helix domain-containing protein [Bacteroidia bacterium]